MNRTYSSFLTSIRGEDYLLHAMGSVDADLYSQECREERKSKFLSLIVRLLTRDDPAQVAAVERLLDQPDAVFWIDDVVLLETQWVLSRAYGWPRETIVTAFNQLLSLPDTCFEERECLEQAVDAYGRGADFADALLASRSRAHGCDSLASLDDALCRRFPDFARKPK